MILDRSRAEFRVELEFVTVPGRLDYIPSPKARPILQEIKACFQKMEGVFLHCFFLLFFVVLLFLFLFFFFQLLPFFYFSLFFFCSFRSILFSFISNLFFFLHIFQPHVSSLFVSFYLWRPP